MNLVLTFDYELFGDGSGNVFEHMIEPTEDIFEVCDQNDIKTTIFFEVVEYWRLKEEWEKGNRMGYDRNPIQAIEQQLREAAKEGHDIQLHLHPQWMEAEYKNDEWQVDFSNWRLGDFNIDGDYSIEDLLHEGKNTLEGIIQEVKPDYECIALRAGAYNIMPSDRAYKAMREVGLSLDSSVYPGGYEAGSLSKYDYRNVSLYKDYWWADSTDISRETDEENEIMEIPVFALQQPRWKKLLNISKIKSLLFKQGDAVSAVTKTKMANRSLFEKVKFLFRKEAFTWDFCLFSRLLHKEFFNFIEKELQEVRNTFVIIGHPKSWRNGKSLKSLIELSQKSQYSYSFKTLKDLHAEFSQ